MDSSLTCPAAHTDFLGLPSIAGKSLASTLLLGLGSQSVDSFITFISQQSTYNWYFALTKFETIFLILIIAHIFVLRWLEILPINVNNWVGGDHTGRRKRSLRRKNALTSLEDDPMSKSILSLLRKLDDQECLLKTLCLLQSESSRGHVYPKETRKLLSVLQKSGKRRYKDPESCDNEVAIRKTWTLADFETAVLDGNIDNAKNGTVCGEKYKSCDTSSSDIIEYVDMMASLDFL